jgi:hypothetical protein
MTMFQGKPVAVSKLQLTGGAKDLIGFDEPKLDQIVRITIEARVTGVDHRVNEQSGDLESIVRCKAIDIAGVTELSDPGTSNVHHLSTGAP